MKKLVSVVCCSCFCLGLFAQKSFGNIVIGLESGFDVAQFSKGIKARMLPALQAEFSIGPVSIGAGVGRKIYREYEYYSFTGETVFREVNGALQMFYLADLHSFKPAYWIFPIKIDYRVHRCDCAYIHLGMIFENVDLGRPDIIKFRGAEFNQPYAVGVERSQLVVPKTRTYEFGVGFNVFRRDFFRLTARPTYALTQNPEVYSDSDVPKWLPTLRFTFGAQFAIWRDRSDD